MSNSNPSTAVHITRPTQGSGKRKLSRDTVSLVGDLLPLCDFTGILLAAYLATLVYAHWISAGVVSFGLWDNVGRAALVAAVLAPLVLCDRAFVSFANGGQTAALIRCYVVRFVMFVGVVAALSFASRSLQSLPYAWLALWFASSLLITALTRGLLVGSLRRLERKGILAETVAVVCAGPIADQLIDHLKQTRGSSVEIIGVFDERADSYDGCVHKPTGSITDLIALGQSQSIDWILIALPASAEKRTEELTRSIVHRLKALAVPIGLCPETFPQSNKLDLPLDNYDLDRFTGIAARFGQQRYGYVVTPNADHVIRLHREPSFRALYADAAYVLLDSRFISKLVRFTQKLQLPVCTGSDLTAKLFNDVITPDDRLVLIGGSAAQAARLRERYGLNQLAHFNPPMGFIHNPEAVETCLQFIEAHSPFRYCLLAVGAPQQEAIAQRLKTRGIARGMALCIGASINFLTGDELRAPLWMQRNGLEWLFRLAQAPGRMAGRYLIRGPQIFSLLRHTEIVLRAAHDSPKDPLPAIAMPLAATAPSARQIVMPSAGTRIPVEHAQPGQYAS